MISTSCLIIKTEKNENQISLKMTPSLYNWIEELALKNKLSKGAVIRSILQEKKDLEIIGNKLNQQQKMI